ncbi:H+transporting two-sector ATPase subunit C [Thermocladium modestius]|uniref:H+transporting two-sector ATPase subunit C n=1 Tax=Thermocladium modestius TaxID=62609 RepID=A0A830GXC6_9CREN|nr:V-type ATPase subunit [Thermocladium modestius]GGP22024.1 H+transporting two-sector ATPase subunit C [Thermocladium modestius]
MSVVSKYPYLGPRVRFLKSKLLGMATIKNLLFTSSLDEFLSYLANTSYSPVVAKLGKDVSTQEFALRVRENAAREVYGVARTAPFLVRMALGDYLMKFEVENIKSIAKGMMAGMDRRSLEAGLNMSIEEALGRRHVIADLMSASNLNDLADRLRAMNHMAYKAFAKALELIHNHQEIQLAILDTLLESSYIEALTRYVRDDESLKEVITDMVDFYNLNILLRGTLWKLQPQVVEDMKVKYGYAYKIPPEDPGRLIEAVSQHPIIANILAVVRQADLTDIVRLLHASYYSYMSRRAREVFGKYTEFSPGAALIISHARDLEGDMVASMFNMVKLNISRDIRQELFILL